MLNFIPSGVVMLLLNNSSVLMITHLFKLRRWEVCLLLVIMSLVSAGTILGNTLDPSVERDLLIIILANISILLTAIGGDIDERFTSFIAGITFFTCVVIWK